MAQNFKVTNLPCLWVFALALLPLGAPATTVTTSTDEDNGSIGGGLGISLREAVKYSDSGSTITFSADLSGKTIRLIGDYLVIDKSLTIDASALPAGLTLSADRTGNGKSSDDTYAFLLTGGNLLLDSLTLADANCGESSGCITVRPSEAFTLILDRCTISRNTGYHAAALYCVDYSPRPTDAIIIRNSTISENFVVKGSSVLVVSFNNLTIQNSTFSQNNAGAIDYEAGNPPAIFSISNSTILSNTANYQAGGLNLQYSSLPATVYINNTICTGNTPTNVYISPNVTLSGSNNLLTGNPLLAPLGDYGGLTQTMPPLPNSRAINAGGTTTLTSDQRGFPRLSPPDIGAVEYQGAADLARLWKLDTDGDGSPLGVEQALGTDSLLADSASSRNLTVPTFNSLGHAVLAFALNAAAAPGTRWVLSRSPDLAPGSFVEIYRYDGSADTAAPGITYLRTTTGVTITDTAPLPSPAFYRFEALLEP